MFLDDVIQFRSNLTQRLVPRYLHPFPFTPFSRTLQGMLDSIRMIEKLIVSDPLDAKPASVLRVIRVAGDLRDLPVFLMNQDATPGHATLTNRPDDLFFHVSPPGFNELWSSYSFSSSFSIQLETWPSPIFYFSSN